MRTVLGGAEAVIMGALSGGSYRTQALTIYLLLCGGDKGNQDVDIKNAHAMWKVLTPRAKKPGK